MGRTVTTRPGQAGIGRRRAATAHRATPHQARSTTLRQTHGHERSRASRGVRTRCHDRTHEDPALTSTCGAGSRAPTVGLLPPTTCRSPRGGPDAAPCLPVGWARDTRGARGRHSSEEDALAETKRPAPPRGGAHASTCVRALTRCAPTVKADAAGGSGGTARVLRGAGAGTAGARPGACRHVAEIRVDLARVANPRKAACATPAGSSCTGEDPTLSCGSVYSRT